MKFSEIENDFKIEEVEVATGCPENCNHCGFYKGHGKECLKIRSITRDQIEENLEPYEGMFAPIVSTTPNIESAHVDVVADLAEIVYRMRSELVMIGHGVRAGNRPMIRRFERIISLIKEGKISLYVLSMDFARSMGKIDPQFNKESYKQTLIMLETVLDVARVTVSLQASEPEGMSRVDRMYKEILWELGWGWNKVNIDQRNGYAAEGRSADVVDSNDCDIIPDAEFLEGVSRTHLWRGKVDMNGKLWAQRNEPGRTYNTSVGEWERVE
ncbi:radical SAM protein [Candidatus Peregrinibacteria bacterium]|nr:radical SAM protein [Candidatus Peregrinibacteria bacterium]MBT4148026.1 radical SAM protein [Candidatus Peregrinibacteria bacterium]MBT4366614.1 radical SAM protein [Candidatus Peregrinibacteria bacterium]MBT4455601.1 radical SAM protein [Candidatus Peregrinibacteria bacterium]